MLQASLKTSNMPKLDLSDPSALPLQYCKQSLTEFRNALL